MKRFNVFNLGILKEEDGFKELESCSDGFHKKNHDGVKFIITTGDKKVEFICYENYTIAYVKSSIGYPAYYPVHNTKLKRPVKAVLMDLDGTSVKSESFWIWIIQLTVCSLLGRDDFTFEEADQPYVSGHSVSEHLQYCINKYCPDKSLEEARKYYFMHTKYEMNEIMEGRGKADAFTPSNRVKEFLLALKKRSIKIGLVTSGLYEKAWPEIVSAFKTLDMGDPKEFYDASISAGFPLGKGKVGTLGELSPKPHPWLYAETCTIGLNIPFRQRHHVVGIEDSGAGVCSIKLAGYTTIGITGGNIEASGTKGLCDFYANDFDEILKFITNEED
ncbi:MAG: HAD family hydrolase [Candidatus Izemoplasmatales bacterium]|jgi:beta-phosphoglucomutase